MIPSFRSRGLPSQSESPAFITTIAAFTPTTELPCLQSNRALRHHECSTGHHECITDFEVRSLVDAHRQGGAVATLAAFHSPDPSAGGVLETDADGRLTGFTEKPARPVSDLVNAGIYAFSPALLDEIGGPPPRDIGYDLLPRLVGRARVVPVQGYFRDIGTPDAYQRARKEWPAWASSR